MIKTKGMSKLWNTLTTACKSPLARTQLRTLSDYVCICTQ